MIAASTSAAVAGRVSPCTDQSLNVSPKVAQEAKTECVAKCQFFDMWSDDVLDVVENKPSVQPFGMSDGQEAEEEELGEHAPVRARRQPPTPSREEVEERKVDHYI